MKVRNVLLAILVLGIVGAVALTPAHAAPPLPLPGLAIYARTDKSSYIPGDSGTLFITVRNQGTSAFTVKNITVTYPWKSFITDHWDGNFTDASINQALATGQTVNKQYTFTVPSDGRVASDLFEATISISVGTSEPSPSGTYTSSTASIQYAAATYQPVGLATSALSIVEIALLGVVVVMLALVWMGIYKLPKK